MKKIFQVEGLHCSSCERLIKMELGAIKGVALVKVDASKGIVEVHGENFNEENITQTIKNLGFVLEKR